VSYLLKRVALALFFLVSLVSATAISNNIFGVKHEITSSPNYFVETNWAAYSNSSNENITFSFGNSSYIKGAITNAGGGTTSPLLNYSMGARFYPYNATSAFNLTAGGKLVFHGFAIRVDEPAFSDTGSYTVREMNGAQCTGTILASGSANIAQGTWTNITGLSLVLNAGVEYCAYITADTKFSVIKSSNDNLFGIGIGSDDGTNWVALGGVKSLGDWNLTEYVPVRSPKISTNTSSNTVILAGYENGSAYSLASGDYYESQSVGYGRYSFGLDLISDSNAFWGLHSSGTNKYVEFYRSGGTFQLYTNNGIGADTLLNIIPSWFGVNAPLNYHEYYIDYQPDRVIFGVDGKYLATMTTTIPTPPIDIWVSLGGTAFKNFSRYENELPSDASIILWGNGSGKYNSTFRTFATSSQVESDAWVTSNLQYGSDGGDRYLTNGTATYRFVAPENYNFSSCAIVFDGKSFTSNWVSAEVSSNGSSYSLIYNISNEGKQSWLNLNSLGVLPASTLYLRGTISPSCGNNCQMFRIAAPININCSLTNTTQITFSLGVGANNLTAVTSNGSSNYNVTISRYETPTLVVNVTQASGEGLLLSAFNVNMSNGTSSVQNESSSFDGYHVKFPMSWLWDGTTTVKLVASGYNTTNATTTLSTSSATTHQFLSYSMEFAALNVFIYDELSLSKLNGTTVITNTTNTTTYTNLQNFSASYLTTPNGAVTVSVNNASNASPTYYPRSYYTTVGTNTAIDLNVYLLPYSVYSSLVRFKVVSGNQQALIGARVTIRKYIDSAWVAVGQQDTDSAGVSAFYMDINTPYQVVATYGTSSTSSTLIPTSQDYVLTFGGTATEPTSYFSNFSMQLTPSYFNSSDEVETISLNVSDYNGTVTSMTLNLSYSNGTVFYNNTVTGSPSGGVIQIAVNKTGKGNSIIASAIVSRSNYNTLSFNRTYDTGTYGNSTYSWLNAAEGIQTSDLSLGARAFLIVFLALLTTAFLARHLPYGYAPIIAVGALIGWGGFFINVNANSVFSNILVIGGGFAALWLIWSKYVRGQ